MEPIAWWKLFVRRPLSTREPVRAFPRALRAVGRDRGRQACQVLLPTGSGSQGTRGHSHRPRHVDSESRRWEGRPQFFHVRLICHCVFVSMLILAGTSGCLPVMPHSTCLWKTHDAHGPHPSLLRLPPAQVTGPLSCLLAVETWESPSIPPSFAQRGAVCRSRDRPLTDISCCL